MARGEAAAILAETGFQVAYSKWPDGAEMTLPCIAYAKVGENGFGADNSDYFPVDEFRVTLCTGWKDDAAEQALRDALAAHGIVPRFAGEWHDRRAGRSYASFTVQLPR